MISLLPLLASALLFLGVLTLLYALGITRREPAGLSRSLAVMDALTQGNPDLTREADPPFSERVLEPLLVKVSDLGRRLSGEQTEQRLQAKIDRAGLGGTLSVDRVRTLRLLLATGFLAATAALSLGLGAGTLPSIGAALLGSALGFQTPSLYLYQKAYDRLEVLRRTLPDSIDLLTISVESGLGFDAALSYVAKNTRGPLAAEFARVLREMQLGSSRAEALRDLADRCPIPELSAFTTAMTQADSFGVPIAQVLRVQSHELRLKRRQHAEERAQKVPVKILFPLIFLILPCLFLVVLGPAVLTTMDAFAGK